MYRETAGLDNVWPAWKRQYFDETWQFSRKDGAR